MQKSNYFLVFKFLYSYFYVIVNEWNTLKNIAKYSKKSKSKTFFDFLLDSNK